MKNFATRYPDESSSVIQNNLIKREQNQIDLNQKIQMSDVVLDNNDNVENVLEEWIEEQKWGLS